jgi:hypothetical protein
MGFYRSAANTLRVVVNAQEAFRIVGNNFYSEEGTWYLNAGAAVAPKIARSGDLNTGIFWPGDDEIAFSAGGAAKLTAKAASVDLTVPILNPDGSNSAPAYSFSGDTNTGMYRIGADNLGFAVNGLKRFEISAVNVISGLNHAFPDGTSAQPSITNFADENTGVYFPAADEVGISCGGNQQAYFTATDQRIGANLFTADGGIARQKINKTGAPSIKGTVVKNDTTVANGVIAAPVDSVEPMGVVYTAGVADGSAIWVVFTGCAKVLQDDSNTSSNGHWAGTSGTTAGRVDTYASAPGAVLGHFQEVGHVDTGAASGTDVLIDIDLHFL